MVRLAAVCPTDPFDGFFAWIGCSFLKSIGLNPDLMHGDLVSTLLSGPLPKPDGSCSSLLESFMGQTCVTQTLWQMTEAAAYPIIIAALGARFARMLAHGNYQVSPGWAVADPVLRAIVAGTFVHLSYGLLVEVHAAAETLAIVLFANVTAAGGVTGVGLIFPSAGGAFFLTDIIYWLYSIYIFFLIIASLIGYQICVVLAPLVIPFWVYSGQNHVFSWFTKTALGALILPIAVAMGWGIVIDIVHRLALTNPTAPTGLGGYVGVAAWMMSLVFIGAGVWFMGKFVKATTGELFSGHLLSTIFLAEATLLASSRIAGAAMPDRAKAFLSRRAVAMNRGGWMPAGATRAAEGYLGTRMGLAGQVGQWMSVNPRARAVAAAAMGGEALAEAAMNRADAAYGSLQAGDVDDAAARLAGLTPERIMELPQVAYLAADPKKQHAMMTAILSAPAGVGQQGSPRTQRKVETGQRLLDAIVRPETDFGQYVEALKTATSQHVPGVENSTPPHQTLRLLDIQGPFDRKQFHMEMLRRAEKG